MAQIETIAKSSQAFVAETNVKGDSTAHLWFKTEPLDRHFCYRAVQLQLETVSADNGHNPNERKSQSWFEVAIYKNTRATQPQKKNNKPLVWRSHSNRTDAQDVKDKTSLLYGMVF